MDGHKMKIDGRKRKRIKPPFCSSDHIFGDFIPSNNDRLIKKCKLCPAIQTKEEFIKLGGRKITHNKIKHIEVSHLDLFHF